MIDLRKHLTDLVDNEAQGMDGPLLSGYMCERIADRVIQEMGLLALTTLADLARKESE